MILDRFIGRTTKPASTVLVLAFVLLGWRNFAALSLASSTLGFVLIPFAIARITYLIHSEEQKGASPYDAPRRGAKEIAFLTTTVFAVPIFGLWFYHLVSPLEILLSAAAALILTFTLPWLLAEALSYASVPIWRPAENCRIRRRMPELRANAIKYVSNEKLVWMSRAKLRCFIGDEHTFNRDKLFLGPDGYWLYLTNMGWIGAGPKHGPTEKHGPTLEYFNLSARDRLAYFS